MRLCKAVDQYHITEACIPALRASCRGCYPGIRTSERSDGGGDGDGLTDGVLAWLLCACAVGHMMT